MESWRFLRRLKVLEVKVDRDAEYNNTRIERWSRWCRNYAEREDGTTAAIVHTQDQLTKLKERVDRLEDTVRERGLIVHPGCGHQECDGYEGCIKDPENGQD